MLTHKEFYIWLEGYLYGKLENKHIDISPIVEKMSHVNEEKYDSIKMTPFERIPIPVNPFPIEDDLGYPPKIVM
jgi:hypothetical protein